MSKFYDHKIKYKTLDQLIDSVSDDMVVQDVNNLIDPSNLIKIVRRINKELNQRITKTKEVLIDFSKGIVNLPNDLEHLNFAVICTFHENIVPAIQGDQTEHIDIDCTNGCTDVYITPCGDTFQIIRNLGPDQRTVFNIEKRVKIVHNKYNVPNDAIYGYFFGNNFLKLNLSCGKIYLNYEGILEDDEGNLLIPDHPILSEYYETAIKERVLENMYLRGEDVERKLAFMGQKLREAKHRALAIASISEFEEIQEVSEINRKAMYKRFFSTFL